MALFNLLYNMQSDESGNNWNGVDPDEPLQGELQGKSARWRMFFGVSLRHPLRPVGLVPTSHRNRKLRIKYYYFHHDRM